MSWGNGWNSILGIAGLGDDDKLYGKKFTPPAYPTGEEIIGKAVNANIATFDEAAVLKGKVDTLNQDTLTAMLEKSLPGGSAIIKENIMADLQGKLPPGVIEAIRRNAAERGVSGGTSDSQFLRLYEGKDLSQQSYEATQRGLNNYQKWIAQSVAPQWDISKSFLSVQDQIQLSDQQFSRDLMESKIAAAPDPGARGNFDTMMGLVGMATSIYGGGGGYQNTYKGQQGELPQSISSGGGNNQFSSSYIPQYSPFNSSGTSPGWG